ncbi:MAG: pyruvate kinase [bacterium]
MLSGETAIGEYPRETVDVMARIARVTEEGYRPADAWTAGDHSDPELHGITSAVAHTAGRLAECLEAKMIIVASRSGATARAISNNRNFVPTVGVSNSEATLRRMCLYWGVTPLSGCPTEDSGDILEYAVERAREIGYVAERDCVVLIAGTGLRVSRHNMIVVHEIE